MVYVFLADGFEEVEALTPLDLLRRAGLETVSVKINAGTSSGEKDLKVIGAHGITVMADIDENAAEYRYDSAYAYILPGGKVGTDNMYASPFVKVTLKKASDDGKRIGAICAAPSIPARLGLLQGITATAYPSFRRFLTENGAVLSNRNVVSDKNFTTAAAAGLSIPFALELIRVLKDSQTAEKIAADILYIT